MASLIETPGRSTVRHLCYCRKSETEDACSLSTERPCRTYSPAYVVLVAAAFLITNSRLTIEWVAVILFVAAILSGRALLLVQNSGSTHPRPAGLAADVAAGDQIFISVAPHGTDQRGQIALFRQRSPAMAAGSPLSPGKSRVRWQYLAASFYLMHFMTPLAAGFLLWMANRELLFQKYMITYVIVFITNFRDVHLLSRRPALDGGSAAGSGGP